MKIELVMSMRKTTLGELIANAVSHGVGFLLAIAALVILLVQSSGAVEVLSSLAFAISLLMLYLSSTLFHSFPEKMRKVFAVFQRLDHASIFLLITGTYTPFLVLVVNNTRGYILLSMLWFITIVGIVFKSIWIKKFQVIHLLIYLIMGWSVLFVVNDVLVGLEDSFIYVLMGGICYTLGVFFYIAKFRFAHFVWHLFVLGGSVFHFISIYMILIR
jgi:hemolysin III